MTEKSEDRLAAEQCAIESMKLAKRNMETVLNRISKLEQALSNAIENMRSHKAFVPENAHLYSAGGKSLHDTIDANIATALAALG